MPFYLFAEVNYNSTGKLMVNLEKSSAILSIMWLPAAQLQLGLN